MMESKNTYIVATRPSKLAVTQTEQVVALLKERNPDKEFVITPISTLGDKVSGKPLTVFGATGVFVKELEQAILRGEADFAVHSLKDVPSLQPEGLALVSFPPREDPRDVLIMGARVCPTCLDSQHVIGTGSPRRIVQLARLFPEVSFREIRGNIDTRIEKLALGEYDGIVLAAAGLKRLGKLIPANAFLDPEQFIPAVGQGALALECRKDDMETIRMIQSVNHYETQQCVIAERAFMKSIGGGCKFPLAAHAVIQEDSLILNAMVGDHQQDVILSVHLQGDVSEAQALGDKAAIEIKKQAGEQGLLIGTYENE